MASSGEGATIDGQCLSRLFFIKGATVTLGPSLTLINGNEQNAFGFEQMTRMYSEFFNHFVFHIVTARPEEDRRRVEGMLRNKFNVHIPPDRLHMMDTQEYNAGDPELVVKFKHHAFQKIHRELPVVARFGDRLWDILPPCVVQKLERTQKCPRHTESWLMFYKGAICSKLCG